MRFNKDIFFNKKAQGLSLSTVVIAALVLVVLIVLILIFSGRLGNWNNAVESCPPNSEDMDGSKDGCDGMTLPSKIINKDGEIYYCCPKEETTTTTSNNNNNGGTNNNQII